MFAAKGTMILRINSTTFPTRDSQSEIAERFATVFAIKTNHSSELPSTTASQPHTKTPDNVNCTFE